ncbi:prefoldin subunit alpha [Candidatus Pacearchaeota archaeon RBG_13_36_9]|nr:MAG: prefoldin subunit alpha [Candidatus Pacearchaeota archaeon RBG_13_36_9]
MAREQYIMQLAALEQEATKYQEQMQMLDQQVNEIQAIQDSLNELDKSKEKTIYANIGKNIFVKTEVTDKNLLVDVGNRTFLKKSIPDTLKIVEEQLSKIAEAKGKIIERLQELQEQMQAIVEQAEKEVEKEEK